MASGEKLTARVKVKNSMGLHTRPATTIVKLLQQFKSKVNLTYKKETVNARSILGILMLAAHQNAQLLITAEGEDAKETLDQLSFAFANKFGEKE